MAEIGSFGPEIPGVPPEEVGTRRAEAGAPEEIELRRREVLLHVTEVIRDPDISPKLAREFLIHEVLFPSERANLEISRWEVNPTLREILRRSGENQAVRRYTKILEEQDSELSAITKQVQALEEEKKAEELKKKEKGLRRSRERTKRIIDLRMRSRLFPEEAKEWFRLYKELDGAVSWHEIYLQREKAQSDVDTYADSLFKSNFFIATAGTSSLIALLEQEEYGPALERALRSYIDIHLKGEINGEKARRILQEKYAPPQKEREQLYEAVRKVADSDPFVAERAEILARHLMETTLLSVWVAVPRNERGEVIYKKDGKPALPSIGSGRLEGKTPTDLSKLILFRLKYWSELNKNYPSVAAGMARYLPESLSPTFLHFMQTKDKKSVFEKWYFDKRPLAEVLKEVPEDAFSSWVYFVWRQNNVRKHLLNFSRGREGDCILQLCIPGSVRPMKKDFDFGIYDPLEKLTTKINMVGCRIYAWEQGTQKGGEIASTAVPGEIQHKPAIKRAIKETLGYIDFLSQKVWDTVERVISTGVALTPEEVVRLTPQETLREILAAKPPTQSALEKVSRRTLEIELKEIKEADKLLREVSKKINEGQSLNEVLKKIGR